MEVVDVGIIVSMVVLILPGLFFVIHSFLLDHRCKKCGRVSLRTKYNPHDHRIAKGMLKGDTYGECVDDSVVPAGFGCTGKQKQCPRCGFIWVVLND